MFKLDAKESAKAQEFVDRTRKEYTGAIGGQYTYLFTHTSLGEIAAIRDNMTGEELTLTDFSEW